MTALPGFVQRDVPIARLTTVGTGGPARYFARPETLEQLEQLLAWRRGEGLDMTVIGLGSNLLAADDGFDGLIIRLAGELAAIERRDDGIHCGGGASLAAVVKRATGWGLSGVEFGCAIPGTVGGAVRMNAGGRAGGPDELGMRYRHSNLEPDEVVAWADLRLTPDEPDRIAATVRDMQRRRKEAQPSGVRTFGSVWKNPSAELSAGRLLEQAGLKGYQVGGARISPVHANFIENVGEARSSDIIALMAEARRRAREQGIELEHEVQMVGPIWLPADA